MTPAVLTGAMNAPALTRGGILFAHIPLPHPPGEMVYESMGSQYEANVNRATEFVTSLVQKASRSGLQVRVVALADHPLRQQRWCRDYPPYVWDHCVPVARLSDVRVPLIVAGSQTLDLSNLDSNLNIFRLASG